MFCIYCSKRKDHITRHARRVHSYLVSQKICEGVINDVNEAVINMSAGGSEQQLQQDAKDDDEGNDYDCLNLQDIPEEMEYKPDISLLNLCNADSDNNFSANC